MAINDAYTDSTRARHQTPAAQPEISLLAGAEADLRVLQNRALREPGHPPLDQILVGHGGVTIVDTKHFHEPAHVERFGGLLARRHSILVIGGRDNTPLAVLVRHQIRVIHTLLIDAGLHAIDVRGALCCETIAGLPRVGQFKFDGVLIDEPAGVAKLAARQGAVTDAGVQYIWEELDARLGTL